MAKLITHITVPPPPPPASYTLELDAEEYAILYQVFNHCTTYLGNDKIVGAWARVWKALTQGRKMDTGSYDMIEGELRIR